MASLPGVGVASHLLDPPAPPGVWSQRPGVVPSSALPGVASQRLTAGVSPAVSHSDFERFLEHIMLSINYFSFFYAGTAVQLNREARCWEWHTKLWYNGI